MRDKYYTRKESYERVQRLRKTITSSDGMSLYWVQGRETGINFGRSAPCREVKYRRGLCTQSVQEERE